ncbi:Hypothetical predicted protein [Octopus vulgaris]|uniref:Uncharacterized protein n=1 Tax=Octopus vulgaris TaxID=6645 RepID=A0AA36AZ13_OCTVU|nr:Hypothetical predicted protein [Octopus vulgaris]
MMTATVRFLEDNSMILSVLNTHLGLTLTLKAAIGIFPVSTELHTHPWLANPGFTLTLMNKSVTKKSNQDAKMNKWFKDSEMITPGDFLF